MITNINEYKGEKPDLWMIDYDGTLEESNSLSMEACEALKIISKYGNAVIISGRPTNNLCDIMKKSRISNLIDKKIHVSGYNGNLSYLNGKIIVDNPLDNSISKKIVELANKTNTPGLFYSAKKIDSLNTKDDWFEKYFSWTDYVISGEKPNINQNYYLIELKSNERTKKNIEAFKKIVNKSITTTGLQFSPPFPNMEEAQWLQIGFGNNSPKALATKKYQSVLYSQKTVTVGDGLNDEDMICLNGVLGIVMSNSNLADKLKDYSKELYQTKNVSENGLLHAVKEIYGD